MRKHLVALVIMMAIAAGNLTAQYFEIGAFTGVSNYSGDLQNAHLEPRDYNMAFGLFTRLNMNRHLSAKLSFTKGHLTGADMNGNSEGQRKRNLSFESDIYELAITGEVNLVPFDIRKDKIAAFYLFGGVAGFHHNPKAAVNGQSYALQPLGTEGQYLENSNVEPYSLYQIAIPMGLGTKINLNYLGNIGFEAGFRKTFTDYLDDVSGAYPDIDALDAADPTAALLSFRSPEYDEVPLKSVSNPEGGVRGNPSSKDWYFFSGITISINLTDEAGLDYTNTNKYFMMDF